MSETVEHAFVNEKFLQVLRDFSKLELYGFKEAQRKKFDFACLLERDWSRPLIGHTLWKHSEGIDNDIRSLVTDSESEIKVYVVRDTIRHRLRFEEIISDFRRSGRQKDLFKMKVFWITPDFNADREEQRRLVGDTLKSSIVQDILFNVVFGHISADDLRFFLDVSGIPGLNLLLLYEIATSGFLNISEMSKRVRVSAGPIREKLIVLTGAGFLITPSAGVLAYSPSLKGRVLLDIVTRLHQELHRENLTCELEYILNKLDCHVVSRSKIEGNKEIFPENPYVHLVKTMKDTAETWGIDFTNKRFKDRPPEERPAEY